MVTSFMGALKVNLFKSSYDPFVSLLKDGDIQYKKLRHPVGSIINAGSTIEVISAVSSASPWGALALVLIARINKQSKRSVVISIKNNEAVHLSSQGYSAKQVESFLEKATNMSVIDASNKKTNKKINSDHK